MFRQSPSRNQRSKGFKVKHALQICLLLGVCIWLLYQVKHSHDKKKAFDESTARISENVEIGHGILKLGRKDLNPHLERPGFEIQHGNEEASEEENKPEEEEEEEEDENKPEETEDEGRGGGDDEIDEHDQEKAEEEAERGEDFIDEEEKDREEKENEDHIDNSGSMEDQDHDGSDRNTQEAREENYKGDDASSAVVRDTQLIISETENGGSEGSNEEEKVEKTEMQEKEQENKTDTQEEQVQNTEIHETEQEDKPEGTQEAAAADQNDSGSKERGETIEGDLHVNSTTNEEKSAEITVSVSENVSQPNSTTTEPNDQPEANNNTSEGAKSPASVMQGGEDIIKELTEDQNTTADSGTVNGDGSNLQDLVLQQVDNSNISVGTNTTNQSADVTMEESRDASGAQERAVPEEEVIKSNTTAGAEDGSGSSGESEKTETNGATEEAEDSSVSSTTNENTNGAQSEHGDSSIPQEEKEARTDLGTLPEIETEGKNSEVAAE
ncbi:PREDICTED: midasin-like [Nelumbo nucifera]|uniref:Midasin-like n=2 Tax=Nelumbo nucifera TaxID=4432 RepID=A0A1U7ZIZ2_NELNU|nr:PREDICTED: midasin-like [Nelumbo nucifera]DAD48264.1 TPA_asm: hypothetical protein HUJ06_018201 [Nelumbo nucifera]